MVRDTTTVLCTGDVHLGRHSTRIPEDLDGTEFSPTAIWRETVQEAIEREVDAVVISGDVADRENRYFEAYGAFEDGAVQLDEAGIPLIVVAGNHDFDVFPRIVQDLDLENLHMLGENGDWQRWTLERDGDSLVHFDGWSFPDEYVYESPLREYDLPEDEETPRIGVLHADLGSRESQYAPVQAADLRETTVTSWVLGHIHSPAIRIEFDPLVLYPGTPQALDPGETGAHGPWLLTIGPDGNPTAEQVPLASVRYARLEVDVTGIDDPQGAMPAISDRLRKHVRSVDGLGSLELVLARVRLTGRTAAHAELVDTRYSIREQLGFREGSTAVRIESVTVDTSPAVDLEERAQGDDAAASIASLLLELQNGGLSDENDRLLEDSLNAMRQAHNAGAYTVLRRESEIERPNREDAVELLEREARTLLHTLLKQKRAES